MSYKVWDENTQQFVTFKGFEPLKNHSQVKRGHLLVIVWSSNNHQSTWIAESSDALIELRRYFVQPIHLSSIPI